jgi:hypothetical protein
LQRQIIVTTTPEKWDVIRVDVIMRKNSDTSYTNIALLIDDEIHLHHERGPILENVVVRTIRRMLVEQALDYIRLLCLLVTLSNSQDVVIPSALTDLKCFSTSVSLTALGESQRSAKAKGEDLDVAQPVVISEDEFELVMWLFERWPMKRLSFCTVRFFSLHLIHAKLTSTYRASGKSPHSHHFPTIKKHSPAG